MPRFRVFGQRSALELDTPMAISFSVDCFFRLDLDEKSHARQVALGWDLNVVVYAVIGRVFAGLPPKQPYDGVCDDVFAQFANLGGRSA
jgi:hypothetical protein